MNQSPFTAFDHQMMARAIALAKQGIYTTAPNPNVGCVITVGQEIIGQGAHLKPVSLMLKCMLCAKPAIR